MCQIPPDVDLDKLAEEVRASLASRKGPWYEAAARDRVYSFALNALPLLDCLGRLAVALESGNPTRIREKTSPSEHAIPLSFRRAAKHIEKGGW